MDKDNNIDRKTLAAAVTFALLLVLAALLQLNIPEDRSNVPGNYNGNILPPVDQLSEKAWAGNSEALDMLQTIFYRFGMFEASAMWNNFTPEARSK